MEEKKTKLIAFDFDGVIGDSVYECYLQSIKGFKELGGKLTDTKEVEKSFRKARPFVKVAEDYDVVLRMIEANPKIDFDSVTQKDFENAKAKNKADYAKFKELFLANRKAMIAKSESDWFKTQADFPGVVKNINKLIDKGYKIVIATTKDKPSVAKLLKQYKSNIKEEDIVSKELFEDKAKQLKFISLKYDVPAKDILFVDDMVEQVKIVKTLGVPVVMADWGYSTKKQRDEAQMNGIPLVEKEALYNKVNEMTQDPWERTLIAIIIIIVIALILNYFGVIHIS
jgi:phosphoglycolate phosphatase-like HAD superfamily hydrolase